MFSACLRADFAALVLKNVPPPPPNLYISEMAFSHRFQKVYTYPPYETKFWCFGQKIEKSLKKCQFAPCWQVTNFPEGYARPGNPHYQDQDQDQKLAGFCHLLVGCGG